MTNMNITMATSELNLTSIEQVVTLADVTHDVIANLTTSLTSDEKEKVPMKMATSGAMLVASYIVRYQHILLLLLGIPGNLICLCVCCTDKFSKLDSIYLVKVLSMVDFTVVLLFEGNAFTTQFLNFNLMEIYPPWSCTIFVWIISSINNYSSYVLACISFDRAFAICLPFLYCSLTNLKTIKTIALAVGFVVMFVIHLSHLMGGHYKMVGGRCVALPANPAMYFGLPYGEFITIILTLLLPLAVIIFSNAAVIWKLVKQKREMRGITRGSEENVAHNKQKNMEQSVTLMLILACVVFILLLSPLQIVKIMFTLHPSRAASPSFQLFKTIALFCKWLNVAINFFLYMISGKMFRAEVCRIFRKLCRCFKKSPASFENQSPVKRSK